MLKERFNYEGLFNNMVEFTTNYITENKLHSAILGISGGIDSTVVSCLLYEVAKKIRRENSDYVFSFFGYSLPTTTTYEGEYLVSTFVGHAFANVFETKDITNITKTISEELKVIGSHSAFRNGNIKSRFRMIYLYDKAKENNGFVVGTDNYTEKLLGFSTIGGDALADYMPLQNLWKTEVYGLAEYLLEKYKKEENWGAVNAINESIKLLPQDGLGITTCDMAQIGAKDYYEVDEILHKYEDYLDYLNMGGYEDRFDSIVMEPLLKNGYKREAIINVLERRKNNFKLNLPIKFEV